MTHQTDPTGPPAGLADAHGISERLAEPFDRDEIKWKPQMVKGERALAVAYVDARVVMDRLDAVFGVLGWRDEYSLLEGGCVLCRLSCRVDGEWIHKEDVGSPSEQPDEGDRIKAAHSDALKRAAVKFGIGRYLYRLPNEWVDYDPRTRTIKPPSLPDWALPAAAASRQTPRPGATRPAAKAKAAPPPPPKAAPPVPTAPPREAAAKAASLPADGKELLRRLTDYDGRMAAQGLWAKGDLLRHVAEAGAKAGHGPELTAWAGPAIELAVAQTKAFEAAARAARTEKAAG
jgi:hypothetical protein